MNVVLSIIAVLIAGFIILMGYSWFKFRRVKNVPAHESILVLNTQTFDKQIKNNLVLVDFWAEWCGPCKMMLPILNDVAINSKGAFKVAKVDVDKNQPLAQKYNVRNIPTIVVFKNGKEVDRFVGIKTNKFLLNEMKKHQ